MSTTLFANPHTGTPLGAKLDEFVVTIQSHLQPYNNGMRRRVDNIEVALAFAEAPLPPNRLSGLERDLRQGFEQGSSGFKPQKITLRQELTSDREWCLIAVITAGR